jgi:hypothetical protein
VNAHTQAWRKKRRFNVGGVLVLKTPKEEEEEEEGEEGRETVGRVLVLDNLLATRCT